MVNYKVENLVIFIPSGLIIYTGNNMVKYKVENLVIFVPSGLVIYRK